MANPRVLAKLVPNQRGLGLAALLRAGTHTGIHVRAVGGLLKLAGSGFGVQVAPRSPSGSGYTTRRDARCVMRR